MSALFDPPVSLLCKLASVAVHADELLSDDGHVLDREALKSALRDPEVVEWLGGMTRAALAPVRRS